MRDGIFVFADMGKNYKNVLLALLKVILTLEAERAIC